MVTLGEATRAVYGSWRLARLDAGGMGYFETSIGGYWRSFTAAALVAPGYAILVLLRLNESGITVAPARFATIQAIAYVIGWVAFPLVMVYGARKLGRDPLYLSYITAYNWSAFLQVGFLLMVIGLSQGFLATAAANLASLIATLLVLVYQGFIARTALRISGWAAAAVVGINISLDVFFNGIASVLMLR